MAATLAAALAGRAWEACVDLSGYTPRQLRASTQALAGCVGRYVYVSAVMAYALPIGPASRPVIESQPLRPAAADEVTEVDGDTYGRLKAACERIVGQAFGPRASLLRPQVVAGPGDGSLRSMPTGCSARPWGRTPARCWHRATAATRCS